MSALSSSYARRQRAQIFVVTIFAPKIDQEDMLTALTALIDPAKDFLMTAPVDARGVRLGPKGAATALDEFMKRNGTHGERDNP